MPTEKKLIRLTGVKNPSEVETHFASCMVDVAYVTAISPEAVRVEVDARVDLCSQITEIGSLTWSDRLWRSVASPRRRYRLYDSFHI